MVLICYGTECDAKTAWIPYIKKELEKRNIECVIPRLPTPTNQDYKTWSKIVDGIMIEDKDIVVGWSTGGVFSLRYLYERNIKVKKLILISSFNNYIGSVPYVDNINKDFFMKDEAIAKDIAEQIICIKSDNDPFITQKALNDFAKNLKAKVINIKNGGHFNKTAGFEQFPQLLNEILKGQE